MIRYDPTPELILGCGSVIITLFLQYWPKISSSLGSYFRTVRSFGAFPVILCVFLVILFTFRSLNLFHSSNFVDFCRSRPLARLDFYWLILNWAFLLSFLTKWLSHFCENEMQKSNNDSVQTCAQEPESTAVPRLAHSKKV